MVDPTASTHDNVPPSFVTHMHAHVGINLHSANTFVQQFIGNPLLIDGRYVVLCCVVMLCVIVTAIESE